MQIDLTPIAAGWIAESNLGDKALVRLAYIGVDRAGD
jgi:hypothetical protein